ncbi:mitochondrial phosphate carrier protein [Actinomortierella ambigua]|nr:mitochondrial phosphate carrier protein [Actinomortierella ambigua]
MAYSPQLGMAGTFRQVIQAEGVGALMTGFSPTFAGYSLQGALKFGGYEFWKKALIDTVGQENAAKNRTAIYLAGAGIAEFIADIALCPLEATRIRLVSQPAFAKGLIGGLSRLVKEEGVYRGLYSGFGPIVFKQVPYTMSKFVVYEYASEMLLKGINDPQMPPLTVTAVNLTAGLIAGIVAAVVSHPADTLLSKINKARGNGSIVIRLCGLASDLGPRGLFLGLGPRILMVGFMSAFQFAIYGDLKRFFGATNGVEIH